MPIYSFGADSPLKFDISEEIAESYNRALKKFFEAQLLHETRTGSKWTPDQALWINWTDEDSEAWAKFGKIFREGLGLIGRPMYEDDLTGDYLVKN